MKGFDFMNSAPPLIEISPSCLRVHQGGAGLDLPLERLPNGKLTPACRELLISGLKAFLKRPAWQPRLRAWCAIGARGVLLRRLTLPPAGKNDFQQLLRLQIENEFPLPPDELAWGYLRRAEIAPGGTAGPQELIVAAVKKAVVAEYSELLAACGLNPIFTLAALARSSLCPNPPGAYAVMEIGRDQSELLSFDGGVPIALRILPGGEEDLAALEALPSAIKGNGSGQKLYLIGSSPRQKEIAARLVAGFAGGGDCEQVEFVPGVGRSAAILGLERALGEAAAHRMLVLQLEAAKPGMTLAEPGVRRWAALAGLLLIGCLLFPFAEAALMKSYLSKQLTRAQASRRTLTTIDRELSFLQYLKQNQSPYLDALYLLANATPGGARIDALSMDRRGEVSIRGNLRDLQQVGQFRSKLIESGFFANVTVEEQTPTPDRQKVIVRISAQWKPAGARESLKIGPTPEEMELIKAATKEGGLGGFPMGGSPSSMPPGRPAPIPGPGGPSTAAAPVRRSSGAMPPRTNDGANPSGLPASVPAAGEKKE